MKITRRQLRKIIQETSDPTLAIMDYKEWASDYMGTPSGGNSSSVLATYTVENALETKDWMSIAMGMGLDPREVGFEVRRQQKEHDTGGTLSDEEIYQQSFMESREVKLTKRQLKRIIREEKTKLLKEQTSGWDNFTPEGEAEDEMYLAAEDMPELLKAIDRNQKHAASTTDPSMASMYEDDAMSLQTIYDMSEKAFGAMQTTPPEQLSDYIYRLDTIVREQIPGNLYGWIAGEY